jgi:hypothetical protein
MPSRFVHRVHTIAELEEAERCVVCGRATSRLRAPDFGQAASTLYLTRPLPEIRVCEACDSEQIASTKIGRKAVASAMAAPLVLVLLVGIVAPFDSPFAIVVAAFAGLVAGRVVVACVRRLRARSTRLLFVDGVGDEVILQLGLDDAPREVATYRDEGREVRTDGLVIAPVGPRMRTTLAFLASTLAVAIGGVVAWFGSYPTLVLDNPTARDVEIDLDGRRVFLPGGASVKRTVGWGRHRTATDAVPGVVEVPWGKSVVFTTSNETCYEVRGPMRLGAASLGETARFVRGPVIVMDQGDRAVRASCAGAR